MTDSIRFYVDNLVDTATMTASTTNAQFPTSNILDNRRTKVFRSTSNSDNIVFDFGSAQTINSIMVVDNITAGFGISTLTLQLNSSNSWGAPPFSQAVTLSTSQGVGYLDFSNQSYRYARIVLTSTLGYCEISNLFIGESLSIGDDRSINYSWNYTDRDNSKVSSNRYDQKFVDILPRQRVLNFQFTNLSKDEMDDVFEVYDSKGTRNPFFLRVGCAEISNDLNRYAGMFYMDRAPSITNTRFNKYSIGFQTEEAT